MIIIIMIIIITIIIIIIIIIKTYNKTPVGETGCLSISFLWGHYLVSPALHPDFTLTSPWRSPPALSSTPTQAFFNYLGIQPFNSLTCELWDTVPRQRSLTLLPREAEDFPRDDRHFKHVPPPTYLIYLSHKELYVMGLFKRYGYLAMKCNVSYEIWALFTIGYCARSSILYPLGHRALWSMAD